MNHLPPCNIAETARPHVSTYGGACGGLPLASTFWAVWSGSPPTQELAPATVAPDRPVPAQPPREARSTEYDHSTVDHVSIVPRVMRWHAKTLSHRCRNDADNCMLAGRFNAGFAQASLRLPSSSASGHPSARVSRCQERGSAASMPSDRGRRLLPSHRGGRPTSIECADRALRRGCRCPTSRLQHSDLLRVQA